MTRLEQALAVAIHAAPLDCEEAARYLAPAIKAAVQAVDPSEDAMKRFVVTLHKIATK
jgi:hypothetical protein